MADVLNFPGMIHHAGGGMHRWPLGRAASCAQVVSTLTPSALNEPHVSRTISRLPDGRYVLTECSEAGANGVGDAVSMADAYTLALLVADGRDPNAAGNPLTTHALAVALLALVGEGAQRMARGQSGGL